MAFYNEIESFGSNIALITEEGLRITYAELAEAANQLGAQLSNRGLAFLLADNCPESIIGYLGILRAGVPVVMQPSGLHHKLLCDLMNAYHPQYLWLPKNRAEEVANSEVLHTLGNYVLLRAAADPIVLYEEMALLVSTSGSTGSPKFVRQSYKNITSNAASIAQYLKISNQDRPITALPMNYVFGLSVINSHLLCGATIILTQRGLMEKQFWNLINSACATSFAGVPYTYEMLRRLHFERMQLPSLKVLTQAGGKLNAALVNEFAEICGRKGMQFIVMYGAAEATARMSYLPPEYALEKSGSIGIPIPGGEFWIEDSNGAIIDAPDIPGELVYRGDNVTLGYACNIEDLANGDERGGILHTGDIAQRDEDGFYYIVGRKSRFIKVFGNRINLEEVEQHIRKQITDCACSGEDDKLRIFITDGSKKNEVLAFIQELTGLHHSACFITVLSDIPRNEFGKITYAALPQ
jgi:long-chain acyl-CoA synthetase